MGHRVFLAINLPEDLKSKLFDWRKLHQQFAVRWTKPASLHLTVVFIGQVSDEQVWQICQLVKKAAGTFQPFSLAFKKILLGPPGRPPRMIWLEGEASPSLAKLKESLENALLSPAWDGSFRKERRVLYPHITLARFSSYQSPSLKLTEENFNYSFSVNSLELMESRLERDGAEYAILESFALESGDEK